MGLLRVARAFVVFIALGLVVALITPVGAGERMACDLQKAATYRSAADRYSKEHDYGSAASWYLAATRFTRTCGSADAALLGARSLAQAGTAYALSGDYGPSLDLLYSAQSRLTALMAADHDRASRVAQPYLDLVERMIAAVNGIARASM